jgi:hypothetical protein
VCNENPILNRTPAKQSIAVTISVESEIKKKDATPQLITDYFKEIRTCMTIKRN